MISTGEAFVDPVLDLTDGAGVDVVFDGGGEATFRASTKVLRTELFDLVRKGVLHPAIGRRHPLKDAARAPPARGVCGPRVPEVPRSEVPQGLHT
ncbi:NADPH:quinone reductase-like Zn-dependent oxidoreductase [Streptomyces sp. SAI-208]|uniref:hypothetical protein n=1 Tax=unclassified Streptomyces TaxID=2593676 RepID=UPI00247423C1|nr:MULTISPECIES: hypothetical protein [unclassified Streptomyces]MDH6521486.1 NADPH:quinone reductase-like Zn-dependent oxidoreductase [Streptomyces sp. SAI-090]MDH6553717.1 NADPH:quinone reductase-like Zn-dependent oxidoreductase [Streptomyces sp. SAI-041]MDH6572796.1 NADPH:quinone reductase-like Zn-dependent oxidoreductase [Streptomyces sp. SAI-117]MDH6582242.1 NADPH:quinone reductase-like Zn-dependent oxidoreductase [Streptomyces sp. SAI-133]MDH6612499.1 NADPH:quinone reductase-like Zn-depe